MRLAHRTSTGELDEHHAIAVEAGPVPASMLSCGMPNRSRKPSDPNALAAAIVQEATEPKQKNPAAVALGKLGGLIGGPARARSLPSRRRREIARMAAKARWNSKKEKG